MNNMINMRAHRLRANLSLRGLANKMGVSLHNVQKWDQGGQPRADKLPALVEVFNLERIEDLYLEPVDA